MIWVSNKKEGQDIKKNLKFASTFLTSESSSNMTLEVRKTKKSILENKCFELKVLISTKVLDCGVNFCDSLLKNVVITATNEVEFIQELGRKRISDTSEFLNLYILPRSKSFFMSQFKNQLEPKREIMQAFHKFGAKGLLRWMLKNDADFAKLGVDFESGKWLQEENRKRYEDELRKWLTTRENVLLDKEDWRNTRAMLQDFAFQCTGWKMNPEHPSRVPEIRKVQRFLVDYDYEVIKISVEGWMICRKKEN